MSVVNGQFTRTEGFTPTRDSIIPRFHLETVEDPIASAREGRPIARDEERVQYIMGGSSNSPVFRVTDEHRERWPVQYGQFKKGQEMSLNGTPLEMWSILKPSNVFELKALSFFTVEQLAEASDVALQKIPMYGQRLRELAKAYLDDSERNALATRLTEENERNAAELATLRHQVEELSALANGAHSELQKLKNAPSAIDAHIPGMSDPVEKAKAAPEPSGPSSLGSLPDLPPRRGRPPLPRDADGKPIKAA